MNQKTLYFWLIAAAGWLVISYLYHPNFPTILGGTVIGAALTFLIVWSSSRIPRGNWWILKVLLISTMAGLMNATALDVLYSLLAAPEGNRYILGIEMVASGLVLTGFAYLRTLFGAQPPK